MIIAEQDRLHATGRLLPSGTFARWQGRDVPRPKKYEARVRKPPQRRKGSKGKTLAFLCVLCACGEKASLSLSPTMLITSLQNPRIKSIVKLASRRQRDADGRTVVEGVREVDGRRGRGDCSGGSLRLPSDRGRRSRATAIAQRLGGMADLRFTQLFEVTPEVFAKIAYRGQSGGLLLVIPYLATPLDQLMTPAAPTIRPFSPSSKGWKSRATWGPSCARRTRRGGRHGRLLRHTGRRQRHRPPQPQRGPGQPGHPLHRARGPGRQRHRPGLAERSTASPPWPPRPTGRRSSPRPTWPVPWPW